jgi:signal transduction histidine kinase
MVALSATLLLVALVASLALVLLTSALSGEATAVASADAQMRASLRTKVALLWYARESDRAASERSPEALAERTTAEADLRVTLADTVRLARPQGPVPVDSLARKTEEYIALRTRLDAEGLPLGAVLDRSRPALESVFTDLQGLAAADDARARAAEGSAWRWATEARLLGMCAAALLIAGFVAVVGGTAVLVERPILALTQAMLRFSGGVSTARTHPRGALELRQMANTFNSLADRLVMHDQDRLAFLSGVAHDLRNPLSAIRLAIDSLHRGAQPPPPEKAARTLQMVARQTDRLDRMVGDLLDATRIEAGRFELRLETSDLRALVDHAVELFRPSAAGHEFSVRGPAEPVVVECDPARIEQVLNNLVSNAIKYSPQGGRVTVAAALEDNDAIVEVADEGIGIATEDRERIFEPFRRTGPARELVPGVGLGLSVARKIVRAHGGCLEVESEPGKGSTFRIRLHTPSRTYGDARA